MSPASPVFHTEASLNLNTMLCPIKVESKSIKLTIQTSCYYVLGLLYINLKGGPPRLPTTLNAEHAIILINYISRDVAGNTFLPHKKSRHIPAF